MAMPWERVEKSYQFEGPRPPSRSPISSSAPLAKVKIKVRVPFSPSPNAYLKQDERLTVPLSL
jgi:hypothetical protein